MRRILYKLPSSVRDVFHDDRGQFAFLTIVGLVPLIFLIFYIVNSGTAIQDATRTQDAADMIALVHAAEGARSMNTLSMNHVSLTQNYVTAVHASSLDNSLLIHSAVLIGAAAEAVTYAVTTCGQRYGGLPPPVGPALVALCSAPSIAYAGRLGVEGVRVAQIYEDFEPRAALEVASEALLALDAQNREVLNRFPEAVSEQSELIAIAHSVEDIYFDNSCAEGIAASCAPFDRRQGMELPVTTNDTGAFLNFCAAMFFGTGGANLGSIPSIPGLPDLGGFGSVGLVNGSFERRQFPINEGPMFSGDADDERYMPIHVSTTSRIGYLLEEYQDMAHETRLFDGVLNVAGSAAAVTELAQELVELSFEEGDGFSDRLSGLQDGVNDLVRSVVIGGTSTARYAGVGFAYPFDQTPENNIFTVMVHARVAAQCAGASNPGSTVGGVLDGFTSALGRLNPLSSVPNFDIYHPVRASGSGSVLPVLMPDLEDYNDAYQPLSFVFRRGNNRWSPVVFSDPNPGFIRYSQAITYNPDELSIYSQNWRSRLIPATRMHDLDVIIQRMQQRSPAAFGEFASDLQSIANRSGWTDLVTR